MDAKMPTQTSLYTSPSVGTLEGSSLGSPLDASDQRRQSYMLCAELIGRGLETVTVENMQRFPQLATLWRPDDGVDAAAVDHHACFGRQVYPFEGVFRDVPALVGGRTSALLSHYAASVPSAYDTFDDAAYGPEHLATQLGHLGRLVDSPTLARRFLGEHVLWWLPQVAIATEGVGSRYSQALQFALDTVGAHALEVGAESIALQFTSRQRSGRHSVGERSAMEEWEPSLRERELRMRLLTPALSGWLLTQHTIDNIGRVAELPTGFGRRDQLLQTLLDSARRYGVMERVQAQLRRECTRWQVCYRSIAGRLPAFATPTAYWIDRLQGTERLIGELTD